MNKSKTTHESNLNVVYVFSENNQVYLRKNNYTKNNSIANEEWHPINFQWKSSVLKYPQI